MPASVPSHSFPKQKILMSNGKWIQNGTQEINGDGIADEVNYSLAAPSTRSSPLFSVMNRYEKSNCHFHH